jgi:hypothetical protein
MAVPRQHIPNDVFTELVTFLRERNRAPAKKRHEWLDRPFVPPIISALLTVVLSGLVVGFITYTWQSAESRRASELQYQRSRADQDLQYQRSRADQRLALLQAFPSAYHKASNVLNSQVTHVLWQAEERNRQKPDEKSIEAWKTEARALHTSYSNLVPPGSTLAQVKAIYTSKPVVEAATQMDQKWNEFQDFTNETNRKWNKDQKLTPQEVAATDKRRREFTLDLDKLERELIQKMGKELAEPIKTP